MKNRWLNTLKLTQSHSGSIYNPKPNVTGFLRKSKIKVQGHDLNYAISFKFLNVIIEIVVCCFLETTFKKVDFKDQAFVL